MTRFFSLLNTVSDEQRVALYLNGCIMSFSVTVLTEFLCSMQDVVSFIPSISLDNLLMIQSEWMVGVIASRHNQIIRFPPRSPSLDLTEETLIKYEDILSSIIQAKSTLV